MDLGGLIREIIAEELEKALKEELEPIIREIVREEVKKKLSEYEIDKEKLREIVREKMNLGEE